MAQQTVTVDFNANIARFTSSIDKATADLNRFQSNASRVAGQVKSAFGAMGAALSVGAVVQFAKSAIDAADNLNDLSQKVGISVEQLAGYKLAAEQSGTTLEGFGTAARMLGKNIAEGDKLLRHFGITSTDVNGAMMQLADVFARMPDGAQKTYLAMELMGRSGADLIPLLNGGGEALQQMIAEGQRLYPITTEMARAADEFNDSLARIKISAEGVGISLANKLLPGLNDLIDKTREAAGQAALLSGKGFGKFELLAMGVTPAASYAEQLNQVRDAIKGLEGARIHFMDDDRQLARMKELKKLLEEIQRGEALKVLDKTLASGSKAIKLPPIDLGGKIAEAFSLKSMDDFVAKFRDNANKIKAEYAKLKADLSGANILPDEVRGIDVSNAIGLARESLHRGDFEGAQAGLARGKALLGKAAEQGESGLVTGYLADQLRGLELQMNDTAESAARQARDTLAQVFDAQKLKPQVDVEDARRQAKAWIETFQAELAANPLQFARGGTPKVYADGSVGVALADVGSAAAMRGARR